MYFLTITLDDPISASARNPGSLYPAALQIQRKLRRQRKAFPVLIAPRLLVSPGPSVWNALWPAEFNISEASITYCFMINPSLG